MLPTSTNVRLDTKPTIGKVDAVMTFIAQAPDIDVQPLLAEAERIAFDGSSTTKPQRVKRGKSHSTSLKLNGASLKDFTPSDWGSSTNSLQNRFGRQREQQFALFGLTA